MASLEMSIRLGVRRLREIRLKRKYYRHIMSSADAERLVTEEEKPGELSFRLTALDREVTVRGGTSDISCLEKILLSHEYETPFLVEPRVIVDAGANIGLATLYYAQKFPQARIFSIEPEESNFAVLTRNCQGLPNVTLMQGALWNKAGGSLAIGNASGEKWAFTVQEKPGLTDGPLAGVRGITIPELLAQSGHDRIDILKLDIEGAETEIFSEGSDVWLPRVGQVVIELHDRFRPGCSRAFYSALVQYPFAQEIRGETIFVKMDDRRGVDGVRGTGFEPVTPTVSM